MGGNTLLWGGRNSDFFRYKVRAFLTKSTTKNGQFIYNLLTIIFNLGRGAVWGISLRFDIRFYPRKSSSKKRSVLEFFGKILFTHRNPLFGGHINGIERGCKTGVAEKGCFAVVGAYALALVAAEYPAV